MDLFDDIKEYTHQVETSPEGRPEALKKLLNTKAPFPPFKVIDLQDLKSSE
jgi:hypothetical protein